MATTYAIDLVPVDERGHTARRRDWRTLIATEPPERFVGFGQPVLAPADGRVVLVHDGEPDHEARRSQLALVPYALGQTGRLRRGAVGLAGNHVVLEMSNGEGYVAIVHLRRGSAAVAPGEIVRVGIRWPSVVTRGTRPSHTSTSRQWTGPIRPGPVDCPSSSAGSS